MEQEVNLGVILLIVSKENILFLPEILISHNRYFLAYGKVFLARKRTGVDAGTLFAMKVLKKATIVQKKKTTEHTKTERQVLQTIRQSPFLVTMHYAFQTPSKLHLVLDYVNGGELFTHLYQREKVGFRYMI